MQFKCKKCSESNALSFQSILKLNWHKKLEISCQSCHTEIVIESDKLIELTTIIPFIAFYLYSKKMHEFRFDYLFIALISSFILRTIYLYFNLNKLTKLSISENDKTKEVSYLPKGKIVMFCVATFFILAGISAGPEDGKDYIATRIIFIGLGSLSVLLRTFFTPRVIFNSDYIIVTRFGEMENKTYPKGKVWITNYGPFKLLKVNGKKHFLWGAYAFDKDETLDKPKYDFEYVDKFEFLEPRRMSPYQKFLFALTLLIIIFSDRIWDFLGVK